MWPGLTALVTLEDKSCQSFENLPVCYDDGMGKGDYNDEETGDDIDGSFTAAPVSSARPPPASAPTLDTGSGSSDHEPYPPSISAPIPSLTVAVWISTLVASALVVLVL